MAAVRLALGPGHRPRAARRQQATATGNGGNAVVAPTGKDEAARRRRRRGTTPWQLGLPRGRHSLSACGLLYPRRGRRPPICQCRVATAGAWLPAAGQRCRQRRVAGAGVRPPTTCHWQQIVSLVSLSSMDSWIAFYPQLSAIKPLSDSFCCAGRQ